MYGLALCNDSKFGYSMDIDEMAIALLKNSVYAHHDPKQLDPAREYRFIERGVQQMTYTSYPHAGSWKDAGLAKRALELKKRAFAVAETYHPDSQPQRNSFVEIDQDEIALIALKRAEDGQGLILRGYETTGNIVNVTISLPTMDRTIPIVFTPYEIKTSYIPYTADEAVRETSMLEV